MDEKVRRDIDLLFESQRIQTALSDLGIFAIDYADHRAFASALWTQCGYTAQDMDDKLFLQVLHPEDRDQVVARLDALMGGETDSFEGVFRLRTKDGRWVWIAASYRVIHRNAQGEPLFYLGHDLDVTAIKEKEAETGRRLAEIETLRQVIAAVNSRLDLADTVSMILDHSHRVIPYDRSSVQLLEKNQLKIIGCTGFEDREAILAVQFSLPDPTNPGSLAIQSRRPLVCNDISVDFPGFRKVEGVESPRSWMGIPLIANNEVIGLLALDSMTTGFYTPRHLELAEIFAGHVALAMEKARMFENVRTMALTDELTGAGNRHALQLQGPFFLEKAKRERRSIIALMIDLDYFKQINDTFGHDAGDVVLRTTTQVIRACLRGYDLFFRFGGEEFLVLLPDTDPESALEIAERIRSAMEVESQQADQHSPTVSIGLGSLVPSLSMVLSDLIKVADRALYQAKNGGRNRVVVITQ